MTGEETLRKRLLTVFRQEAADRLRVLADGLAMMEQDASPERLESLYREIHSLKGAARAVSLAPVEKLCQSWESLFSALKRQQIEWQPEYSGLCHQAHQWLQAWVTTPDAAPPLADALCQALETCALGQTPATVPTVPAPTATPAGPSLTADANVLRVSATRLDSVLFHLDELQQTKLEARENALALRDAAQGFASWRRHRHELTLASRQLKRGLEGIDAREQRSLQVLLDFVDWSTDHLGQWEHRLGTFSKTTEKTARNVSTVAEALRQEFQSVLILPCAALVEGVPAMVRDIATASGKQVNLQISGESLQVDKRILDELRSPLQHLLRNAIDHGIETPSLRRQQGKPDKGQVRIEFVQEHGGKFELRTSDDGVGLDAAKLKDKAIALGLLDDAQAAAMSSEQAQRLVFTSGFTTNTMITDLSGRGLGLAIVQEKVERVGGDVSLQSRPGEGSLFILRLPASLATYRALLVQSADQLLAIPAHSVERVLRQPVSDIKSIENRLTLKVGGDLLPLWRLADVLQLGLDNGLSQASSPPYLALVILRVGEDRFGLMVDRVVGDQEITIKSLGRQLLRVRNIMGATPLGDGQIVPILHPQDLYKSACLIASAPLPEERGTQARRKRVLIAEDSVTSRGLLKNILDNAGYEVSTATDGQEAWNMLKQSDFDIVVSDIEMPRMDGFVLTAKVRADRRLGELPVVLVTALQSPEDRARGMDAGANAYIVKSGFDQASLLDVVNRLI